MSDIAWKLAEPFAPHIVSFRVGPTTKDKTKGMALAYIDARDVMRRLDEVCGPASWQDEYPWSDGKRVVCRIGIKIGDEWIWKTDGAGDTDTEGEKGALSDAFKRAAVKWGVGRYLYDVEAPWVEIEQKGQSYAIKQSELARLRSRLPAPRGSPAPAQQRPALEPALPLGNGTAPQARPAANGQAIVDHPRRQEALDAYAGLRTDLETAQTLKLLDAIIESRAAELALIKEVHEDSYYRLLKLATARRQEFFASA